MGWSEKWDEFIDKNVGRIAPRGTHTVPLDPNQEDRQQPGAGFQQPQPRQPQPRQPQQQPLIQAQQQNEGNNHTKFVP